MQRDEKAKRKPPSLKNDAKFAFLGLLKERSRLRFFNPLVENLSRKNGFLGCHRAALINYRLEKTDQSKTPR